MDRTLHNIKVLLLICCGSLIITGCHNKQSNALLEEGVSWSLAQYRKGKLDSISYDLHFAVPDSLSDPVTGHLSLSFLWNKSLFNNTFVLDFKQQEEAVKSIILNGKPIEYTFSKEHIYFSGSQLRKGQNVLEIDFTAGNQSLNRRKDFMYTLLVPDRARTLFPCFDQPNLKAVYTLDLQLPDDWAWVSNSPVGQPSEPLSTYLFSFVAGKFLKKTMTRVDSFTGKERTIGLYYRETDPNKTSQIYQILEEIFECVEWLEAYTGIAYPFAKYDCIVLPGFQYGGMEHTGATLYNDTRIFLNANAGIKEQMNRFSLLSHETAHMWFGDYVTMEWFDDVWTKEVFANYFSALMMKDKYPDVDNAFTFIDYATAAYTVDRTDGANAIKQPLDNLRNAGLIYGNIIYNKAPFVMNMLAEKMGPEAFRTGIRNYLNTYAYGNATWEDLVDILDRLCPYDLTQWSRVWVQEKGMPHYHFVRDSLVCTDPFGRGLQWPQEIQVRELTGPGTTYRIPNLDAKAYGYFALPDSAAHYLAQEGIYALAPEEQASALAMLNENYRQGNLDAAFYMDFCLRFMERLAGKDDQPSTLLFSQAAGYFSHVVLFHPQTAISLRTDERLMNLVCSARQKTNRNRAFGCLTSSIKEPSTLQQLYNIFIAPQSFPFLSLTESSLTALAYQLAIRMPEKAAYILNTQRSRITHPDRLAQFDFISQAVNPDSDQRLAFFNTLLLAENRRIEPWASQALSFLNHPAHSEETLRYIRPALEKLEEVQLTGDIFFPTSWLSALLNSQTSPKAYAIVQEYLNSNPGLNPLLRSKVLQNIEQTFTQ